jgi:hypothetical protein
MIEVVRATDGRGGNRRKKLTKSPALTWSRHMKFEDFHAYPNRVGSNTRRMKTAGRWNNDRAKDEA